MFGGRLHGERLRLYRKYLCNSFQVSEHFKGGHSSESARNLAAEKNAVALIAKQNRDGLDDPTYYFGLKEDIAKWRNANRILQRKNAAKARWAKEQSKKPLDGLGQS